MIRWAPRRLVWGLLVGLALVAMPAAGHTGEPVIPEAELLFQIDASGQLAAAYNLTLLGPHDRAEFLVLPARAESVQVSDGSGRIVPVTRDPAGRWSFVAPGASDERMLWVTYTVPGPLSPQGVALALPTVGGAFVVLDAPRDGQLSPELRTPQGRLAPLESFVFVDRQTWRWDTDVLEGARLQVAPQASDLAGIAARLAPGLALVGLVSLAAVGWTERRVAGRLRPRMRVLEHLEEVRWRLVAVLASLAAGLVVFFGAGPRGVPLAGATLFVPWPEVTDNYAAQILRLLAANTVPDDVRLVVTGPLEAVVAELAVALLVTLVVGLPVLLWEVYRFVRPGLFETEARWFRRGMPLAVVLFVAGVAFAYAFLVPFLVAVLYGFAEPLGAEPLLTLDAFLSFVGLTLLVMGLAFELPAVMAGAAALGIASPALYWKYWRHAAFAAFLVSALATDPTLISQIVVGSVLLALYFLGIALSRVTVRRRAAA